MKSSDVRINCGAHKLKVSSPPHNIQCLNTSSDKKAQEKGVGNSFLQCRYLVALMEFFVYFEITTYRLATSVSVVAMVNNTSITARKNANVSIGSCYTNISDPSEHSFAEADGEFAWSPSIQGYILGAGFFGYVLTQIPGGVLAEAYGAKITIVCGLFLSSISHLLSPFSAWSSWYLMIAMQLLRGLGQGLMPPALCVLAANWFPSTERGLLNPVVLSGHSIGALISGFSSGYMCSSSLLGGWPSVYYIYGGLGLVLCLCFQVFVFESPRCHPRIRDDELTYILQNMEGDLSQKRPPTPWKAILTSVPVYALTYAIFASFWKGSHFVSVQPIFLGTILHFPIKENGIFTSVPLVFQTLLTIIGSWISKWLNAHSYVGVDKVRKGCNFLCCLGYSLGLLGVYFAGCNRALSNVLSITAMGFIGLSFNGCMITPNDMSPNFAGTLMGLSCTIASTASFIFPVLVGIMTDEAQTMEQWNKIFLICIGLIMSSGVIFCIFGSAEVQPWNFIPVEENDEHRSKNSKKGKEHGETENWVDAVTQI